MKLHIRDVSKTYPDGTQALKDVSLDVPPHGETSRPIRGRWRRPAQAKYRVTSEVAARGIRADSVGTETEVRMNDPGRHQRLRARRRQRRRPAFLSEAASHPQRQTDDQRHRSAGAGPGRIDFYRKWTGRQRNGNVVEVSGDAL
jgi:hypothetical protein